MKGVIMGSSKRRKRRLVAQKPEKRPRILVEPVTPASVCKSIRTL